MKIGKVTLILALTACGSSSLMGAEVLTTARSTLEKWVEARRVLAEERAQWLADEKTLNDDIAFLKSEIDGLRKTVADSMQEMTTADSQQNELGQSIAAQEQAIEVIRQAVPGFEKRILALSTIFPSVFQEKVATQLRRIPDPDSERQLDVSLGDRVQNIISLLNNIEYFNKVITPSSELREKENGEIFEVKTLYIGFGQAYFVDENHVNAGFGYPVIGKGWVWQDRPEIADAVGLAVLAADNRHPAEFVNVPVEIKEAD